MSVRTARVEDAPRLAELAGELGYPADATQMRSRLVRLADLPDHWIGVAVAGARAVQGWVHVAHCITLETGEYAEILGLVVASQARRGGVGRQLVAAAERWSGDLGVTSIAVRSNLVRAEAHHFYPALGYEPAKSQRVYAKMLPARPATP